MRDEILIYNDSGTGDIRPLRDSLREHFSPQGIKIDTVTADDIIKNERLNSGYAPEPIMPAVMFFLKRILKMPLSCSNAG